MDRDAQLGWKWIAAPIYWVRYFARSISDTVRVRDQGQKEILGATLLGESFQTYGTARVRFNEILRAATLADMTRMGFALRQGVRSIGLVGCDAKVTDVAAREEYRLTKNAGN